MKKIARTLFISSSIAFGIIGILLVLANGPDQGGQKGEILFKLLFVCVFIILPSFALSIASKYFSDK